MLTALNNWGPAAVIVAGYILGFYFQNRSIAHLDKRMDDLRTDFNKRIDDLRTDFHKRMDDLRADFNKRMDDLRELIQLQNKHLEERLDRLESPIHKR